MADTKISALSANAGLVGTDLFAVVDDPAGTPATQKATISQIRDYLLALANTWTATQTITPAANTNALAVTGYSLTGSNAQSLIDLAGTWNTTGTPTALKLNITDTASNASSLLIDLQVGGTSRFSVTKVGSVTLSSLLQASGALIGGVGVAWNLTNTLTIPSSGAFNFGSSGVNSPDTFLVRDAANTLAQRNSTSAQAFRIYNTYTDASNYERGKLEWASNVFRIGVEVAGTGTSRAMAFQTAGTTQWTIDTSGNFLAPDVGSGQAGFEGGSCYTVSGSVFKSRGIAYLDSTTGAVNLRPGGSTILSASSTGIDVTGFTQMTEQTAPSAPATNSVRIYAQDNGAGKTQLMALFATGAAQQIAIEP